MSKLAHSAIIIGVLALAAAPARPAYAEPKTAEETAMAEAKQRFAEGIKFADAGDHEAARLKFSQAWSLLKSPAILYNLARSEQLSNHPVEALEHYRLFQKMASDPKVTEQQRLRATENVAELSKKVAQIDIEAPRTAHITIDGKAQEWTAGQDPIPVLAGNHVVESVNDGKTQSVTIECAAGTVSKAKLNEPAPSPGVVAPPPKTIEPPKEEPAGFWTTGRAVGAGLLGAGLVGAGLGVVFQLKAQSNSDDAGKIRAPFPEPKSTACVEPPAARKNACAELKSKTSDLSSAETLRTTFFIAGGALVVGGAVLFLVSPPKQSEHASGVHVLPYASASDAGLQVFGRF